ncbi:MAG TPA: DUF5684 domain-containing protein [Ktedonobacterales bacterium]
MTFATLLAHSFALDTSAGNTTVSLISNVVALALFVLLIAAQWVVFSKAGKPGWAAIIPFYSTLVELEIVGRPWWWLLLLMFVPIVNIVLAIMLVNDLSKSFGHGVGFTLGLIFLPFIFLPILAFGGSQYVGPAAAKQLAYAG